MGNAVTQRDGLEPLFQAAVTVDDGANHG